MNFKNWRNLAYLFIIFGIIQYIIFSGVAMSFYAGGTLLDPFSPGYSFFSNFFSDLGRTIALSGRSNTISFTIFIISALIMSSSIILFALTFPRFFKDVKKQFSIILVGSILGIFSGIFLIAVILTPWDIFNGIHLLLSNLYSLTGFVVVILYLIAILLNKNYKNFYAFTYLTLVIVVIIYMILLLAGPSKFTTDGLVIQATMQKISQYSFLVCFIIQGYGAWKSDKAIRQEKN